MTLFSGPTVRWLDPGPRNASENTAMDEVLLRARDEGVIPDTFRLLSYRPHCVLVGRFQDTDQEVRWPYCRDRGVAVERRVTGGGTVYFGEQDLGWEVVAGTEFRREFSEERLAGIGVVALRKLGVEARFRPRNDIEVRGRKISGTGGVEEKHAFLFQGTLLVKLDPEIMLRSLRVPTEKLARRELASVRERVTSLADELPALPAPETIKRAFREAFEEVTGRSLVPGTLLPEEERRLEATLARWRAGDWTNSIQTRGDKIFLTGTRHTAGGLVRAHLAMRPTPGVIEAAVLTGDFFASPSSGVAQVEAALKFCRATPERIDVAVREALARTGTVLARIAPGELVELVADTAGRGRLLARGFSAEEINRLFPVGAPLEELLDRDPELVLLPYCAKKRECDYRFRSGCGECGECTVGEGARFFRGLGKRVVTVQNYEELEAVLAREKSAGTGSFLGSCCEAFYAKHLGDFDRIGLPGLLVGVAQQTCYELGKYREAHEGRFENQTQLDLGLLRRVAEGRACVPLV